MDTIDEKQMIDSLKENIISKSDKINFLFPNLESQVNQYRNEIDYALNIITKINNELDNLLILNNIENMCHEGMKQLEYIFNNIIDRNNQEQINKLENILNNLKKNYKLPTNNYEQTQTKYIIIKSIIEQISEFQNEISCKTLCKIQKST